VVNCDEITPWLDAYADGELTPPATSAIHDHVDVCSECRRRLAAIRTASELVRRAPVFTTPSGLRERVARQARRSVWRRRLSRWTAAALVPLALGVGLTRLWTGVTEPDTMADAVVDGHVRSLLADHLMDVASTDQHTVKPWFVGRLDFSPPVVDLAPAGFPLVGGRLDYLQGRPAAALVYRRRQHTINVFVLPDEQPSSPSSGTLRGFHVRQWSSGGMAFWAVSDLQPSELADFVRAWQASGAASRLQFGFPLPQAGLLQGGEAIGQA
jgi:anti-sigma factor RsiW